MSAMQVGFGLYGAFLVEDPTEAETVGVDDSLVILLSDMAVTDDGELDDPDSGGSAGMAFGREGNHVLVNGRKTPHMLARSGAPQRWQIVNAAKSRYYMLDLGEEYTFTKVGGDGGLLEYSVEQDFLVLGAGERADVIITPRGVPGDELMLRSQLHDRGYGSTEMRTVQDLVAITIADQPRARRWSAARGHARHRAVPRGGRHGDHPDAHDRSGSDQLEVRVRHQRRAVLEGEPGSRRAGRDPDLDGGEYDPLVASAPPARVLLHGARRGRRTSTGPARQYGAGAPYRCVAATIWAKLCGSRLAPPTSAPSTSGWAASSAAFPGLTLPP